MPITRTAELKERIQLFSWIHKENDDGEIVKRKKSLGLRWGHIHPCSLSSITLNKISLQTSDAKAFMMKAYTLTLRFRELEKFDGVEWSGEFFRRISPLQREGAFNKCVIAAFEEKQL